MAFVDPAGPRQMEGWNQSWANDGKCRAHFYKRSVLDERATHGYELEREVLNDDGSVRIERKRFPGAGRPIFREAVFIKKFTPGDATNIVDREKWPHDEEEFPQEWARFVQGDTTGVTGTPLEMLPGLPAPRIEELKHLPGAPIRTIEELASMSDGVMQRFVGLHGERQRARDWLAAAEKQAPVQELRSAIAQKDQEMDAMRERMAALEAALAAQKGAPKGEEEKPAEAHAATPPTVRRR